MFQVRTFDEEIRGAVPPSGARMTARFAEHLDEEVARAVRHFRLVGEPLGRALALLVDGLTGDQRFFLGWAQVWRRNYREANLRQAFSLL